MINTKFNPRANNAPSNLSKNLSLSVLAVCVTSILGCQSSNMQSGEAPLASSVLSSDDYQQKLAQEAVVYQQLFDKAGANADVEAKSLLLKAIHSHLRTDHVAVSDIRMHDRPFIQSGSVDEGSNSVWSLMLEYYPKAVAIFEQKMGKTPSTYEESEYEYDDYEDSLANYDSNDDVFYGEAYRTEDTYLEEPDALYLSYIDEKLGTLPTPDYAVDRQTGMSYAYSEVSNEADRYSYETYECVDNYRQSLDSVIYDDNTVTKNSEPVKLAIADYLTCKEQIKEDHTDTMANAIGYQKQYIQLENKCVGMFDTQINDILDPARQPKNIDYEQFETIFSNYEDCDYSAMKRYQNEPASYIAERWPEYMIQYNQGYIECADDMLKKHDALIAQGITYKNNSLEYAKVAEEVDECKVIVDDEKYEAELYAKTIAEAQAAAEEAELSAVTEEDAVTNDDYDYGEGNDVAETDNELLKTFEDLIISLKLTPEQIKARNFYVNKNQHITSISEFNVSDRQVNTIYSYDYASPTSYHSFQLPIALDFNTAQVIVDPSVIMPLMAIVDPESTPLPEEMTATIAFALPEPLSSVIPTDIIYDALLDAISVGLSELDSGNFTALDIRNDTYAKTLGASSAIKVNLNAKQTGKVLGTIVKQMGKSLKSHIDSHPEEYSNAEPLKAVIEKWQKANEYYQTEDVGAFLQLLEAVAPLSFDNVSYYYLDRQGKLLGKQVNTSIGGDIIGTKSSTLSQTRYDTGSFNKHPLNQLFVSSYGQPFKADSPISINGNALIEAKQIRKARLNEAQSARSDYDDDVYYEDEEEVDYHEESDTVSESDVESEPAFAYEEGVQTTTVEEVNEEGNVVDSFIYDLVDDLVDDYEDSDAVRDDQQF